MSAAPEPETRAAEIQAAELAARAARRHVVVVGGGISGLIAARECAKVGMRVSLFEASDALGGAIRSAELGDILVDVGAESFATRGGHVRALLEELGLGDRVVSPDAGGAWLAGIPGTGAAPLPAGGILGIPANPFQEDVRRIIGWSGTWRAYLDRVRPPLTIGHQHSLGALVASRMGARVRDRLVAPVTIGVYSASPEDVDVDVAAPGLNAALTRVGSLSGAVAALREAAEDKTRRAPGAAVQGIDGGMSALVAALEADLLRLGTAIRTGAAVQSLARSGEGWIVTVPTEAGADENAGDSAPFDSIPDGAAEEIPADAVIVAIDERAARALLAGHVPGLGGADSTSAAPEIEIVTLLLDAPALDDAPRGSGVLTVPGSHTAKALTHSTAKWSWLRESAAGRQLVRVSFGAQGESPATSTLDDEGAARLALTEAAALLGVALHPAMLVDAHRARYIQSQPASIIGADERRAADRSALQAVPGVTAVGAWLAGTGLAQVIPDAKSEADRLRRALLWP